MHKVIALFRLSNLAFIDHTGQGSQTQMPLGASKVMERKSVGLLAWLSFVFHIC